MKVLEFRKIRTTDTINLKYEAWSRIYEYPLVLNMIKKYKPNNESIHNSSWGFSGCHITFKEELDKNYNTIHTDIKHSNLSNTSIWDITESPPENYINKFDVVLNISTVEEVNFNHLNVLINLYNQVADRGILIITFDLPGLQLNKIEDFLDMKIERFDNEINGSISKIPNNRYTHLTCGILVIQKI